MAPYKKCPHVFDVQQFLQHDFEEISQGNCHSCRTGGPNVWLCLQVNCQYVGCGESVEDHSSQHTEETGHAVAINLKTQRSWCSECDQEVFPNAIISVVKQKKVSIEETVTQQHIIREPAPSRFLSTQINSPVTQAQDEFSEDRSTPRGLTGLRNLGNTCYLSAGIQALSNCPPFTHFFLECDSYVTTKRKPYIAKLYQRVMQDIWGRKRPTYLTPNSLVSSFKLVCPMFKGYTQQDSQEFLRCFMDRLHEELKEPCPYNEEDSDDDDDNMSISARADSPTSERGRRTRSSESLCSEAELNSLSDSELNVSSERPGPRRSPRQRTVSASGVEVKRLRKRSITEEHNTDTESVDATPEADQQMTGNETGQGDRRAALARTSQHHESMVSKAVEQRAAHKKKKTRKYRSIVSDVFDGRILSSVQCLTCENVSCCKETFQDLSLPIPGKEDLFRIHASQGHMSSKLGPASCSNNPEGSSWYNWFTGFFTGWTSWFYGPNITLDDCLAAFFSADDLKGDNMYSCEKCKKLRNGVKFSQVQELPEVLCIHLKRFRHESFTSYSSKIANHVSFPLDDLDMSKFVSKDCPSKCKNYELIGVICHHGTAGGGHYTAYAQNWLNGQWYEFDDTYVTEVEDMAVMNAEAYVLFYRKSSDEVLEVRQKVMELFEQHETSLLQFYISLQWLNKFNTFVEPGPITNYDFLCEHGGVPPNKAIDFEKLFVRIPGPVWELLHERFGGGPVVNYVHPSACPKCMQEMDQIRRRRQDELQTFIQLHEEFQRDNSPDSAIYYISLAWFKQWENYVKAKEDDPPGPIDNKAICINRGGYIIPKPGSASSAQISEDTWNFLHSIYEGGPEVAMRPSRGSITESTSNNDHDSDMEDERNYTT